MPSHLILYIYNVSHHHLTHTITSYTFLLQYNLLSQLLYNNVLNLIRLYIAAFIQRLFNLLTGLYIIASLAAVTTVLLSR